MIVVEATTTRRLKPVWAFLASVFILGLGLVYVGKLRLAIATVATVYGVVALFSWTRLMVSAPYGCWVAASVMLLIIAVTAIDAAAVAIRSPLVAANSYNRGFFYLLWILMVFALSLTAYRIRERVFGYGTYAVPSVSMSPTVGKGEVDSPIQEEVLKLEETDEVKAWMALGSRDRSALLTYPQLLAIIDKNWKDYFQDLLRDEALIQEGRWISHIRNAVCHMSAVPDEELERIRQVMRDWFRVLPP